MSTLAEQLAAGGASPRRAPGRAVAAPGVYDSPNRTLRESELRRRDEVMPALRWWTWYFTTVRLASTYAEAVAGRAPILLRRQREGVNPATGFPHFAPVVVNVEAAQAAMQEEASRLLGMGARLPGSTTGVPQMLTLAVALDFMGREYDSVRPDVATFLPVGEQHRGRYRRPGWWQLHGEAMRRLQTGVYVPVLASLRGRPPRSNTAAIPTEQLMARERQGRRPLAPMVKGRVDLAADGYELLRDLVATTEPTCMLTRAVGEDRPLALRPRGRPPRNAVAINFVTSSVLVTSEALARHGRRAGARLERSGPDGIATGGGRVQPWTVETVSHLMDVVSQVHGDRVQHVERFAALDDPARSWRGGTWWRVSLLWLGHPGLDPVELTAEWRAEQARLERGASTSESERVAEEEAFARESEGAW